MPPASGAWPRKEAPIWQQAPFFRLLLPLIAGIFVYQHGGHALPDIAAAKAVLGLCVLCFACWVFLGNRAAQNARAIALRFVSLNVFFLLAGWLSCFFSDVRTQPAWYGHQLADSSYMLAQVLEPPRDLPKTQKLEIRLLGKWKSNKKPEPVSGKAFLLVYKNEGAPLLHQGDTLLFPARWQPITNSSNPFAFDYAGFCQRRGLYHQTFAGPDEIVIVGKGQPAQLSWLRKVNRYCTGQLRQYLPGKEAFGLLQAMLLGNEQDFDPELRQAYADTGVVHIVSISGSHTAMLFIVVTWLFFWLRKAQYQWLKYAAAVALVWIYVLVAGAPPSALRSAVMFTVFALSFMAGQEQQPLNTLLLAAFVLLLANPLFLFAIGFQLSFVAVLSLILFYRPIVRLWPQKSCLMRKIWQLTAGSLAVEILIAPLVIFYFHNLPVLAPVANIAAIVMLGIVALIGGLAILALSWWPFAARLLGWVVSFSVEWFNRLIVQMQGWSPPSFKHLVLDLPELILLYSIILFISVFLFKKKKPALFAGLGLLILLLGMLLNDQYRSLRQQRLLVYQVNNRALIDLLHGKQFIAAGNDTAGSSHRVVVTSRTGYSAWQPARQRLPEAFLFKDQKVLLWQEKFLPESMGPVDVLILTDSLRHFSLSAVKQAFTPRQIVVAGPQSRWLLRQWADSAHRQGQPFHSVMLDGAFMLE